jgi:hypothetical protein
MTQKKLMINQNRLTSIATQALRKKKLRKQVMLVRSLGEIN